MGGLLTWWPMIRSSWVSCPPTAPQSELRYHQPPLTAGARLLRGFRRIGVAIALPVLLVGTVLSVLDGIESADNEAKRDQQLRCMAGKTTQSLVIAPAPGLPAGFKLDDPDYDAARSGCPGPRSKISRRELEHSFAKPTPSWTGTFLQNGGVWAVITFSAAGMIGSCGC